MKRKLLSLFVLAGIASASYAQCTPDPAATGGITPDSATGLPTAYTFQPYDLVLTLNIPEDTVGNVPGLGQVNAQIQSIDILSVDGLPSMMQYSCNPANCSFPGNSQGCINLFSVTDPVTADIASYPITIEVNAVLITGFGPIDPYDYPSTIDYYILTIADSSQATGLTKLEANTFKTLQAIPNPTSGNTRIEFALGYNADVTFKVTNLLGEVISTEMIQGSRGVNIASFDATNIPNGVYLYSLSDGKNMISKKLIVSK
ncbi:MAG: hypothetical protein ACI9N1_002929 [Flavobacteriales bacterium]|jgi:hypothetical protein